MLVNLCLRGPKAILAKPLEQPQKKKPLSSSSAFKTIASDVYFRVLRQCKWLRTSPNREKMHTDRQTDRIGQMVASCAFATSTYQYYLEDHEDKYIEHWSWPVPYLFRLHTGQRPCLTRLYSRPSPHFPSCGSPPRVAPPWCQRRWFL